MSVTTRPSTLHILSPSIEPLAPALACWPFSLPAMFMRSSMTPGTFLRTPHGSRAFGIFWSSSVIIVVDVPRFLTSTSGVSPMTSTVSCTPATLSTNGRLTFSPAVTTTSRVVVPKPARVTLSV